jgi:hypothetical protein
MMRTSWPLCNVDLFTVGTPPALRSLELNICPLERGPDAFALAANRNSDTLAGNMSNRATSQFLGYRIAWNVLLGLSVIAVAVFHPVRAGAELTTADPLGFFTNLSSRLLQSEVGLSLNRIQIYPTNQYSPAVHRLLQVTANILDATTNRFNTNYPRLPSVFRPLFTNDNDRIYICGYEEENGLGYTNAWRDLNDPAARGALQARDYVYGIPVVIGAKKGFPNFNAFAMQTVFQISRRLEITRPSTNAPKSTWQTNQMFILGISNVFGVELWNSFRTNYPRAVDILADFSMTARLTNNFGLVLTQQIFSVASLSVAASNWSGWGASYSPNPSSFLVPVLSNIVFLPDSIYQHGSQNFTTNSGSSFETGLGFPIPKWGITFINRLRVFMVDQETQRLVDFVTLEGLNGGVDLSEAIRDVDFAIGFDGLWTTNLIANRSLPQGVFNQIDVGLGNFGVDSLTWRNYGTVSPPATLAFEVDYFRALYHLVPFQHSGIINTSLVQTCPFTPTRRISTEWRWQANDPLLHRVLPELKSSSEFFRYLLSTPVLSLRNISAMNDGYLPWGGNPFLSPDDDPNRYNAAIKDPLAWRSDSWNFPDAEPLSLTMLGRIHRGTPWQTIYLKSAHADAATWLEWLHDGDAQSAQLTHPTRDWQIAALVASLLNTNSPHQLLSVNNRDSNAWLAKFDGLNVLTNTATDASLLLISGSPSFDTLVISSNPQQVGNVLAGILAQRSSLAEGLFRGLGDVLGTPELTLASPWLNQSSPIQVQRGITDEAYERIPAQLLPLLRADSVGSVVWHNGNLQAQFTGFDNYPYAVESSSNLVNWVSFSTNYPTNGVFALPVSAAGTRFFRSRLLP